MKEIVVKRARFAFLNAGFYDAAELVLWACLWDFDQSSETNGPLGSLSEIRSRRLIRHKSSIIEMQVCFDWQSILKWDFNDLTVYICRGKTCFSEVSISSRNIKWQWSSCLGLGSQGIISTCHSKITLRYLSRGGGGKGWGLEKRATDWSCCWVEL